MVPGGVAQLQLLATKYHVQGDPLVMIPRPHLRSRLDVSLSTSHVLVRAPAGYGKSTLLADWYRKGAHPVKDRVWISLDPEDQARSQFWAYFMGAFRDEDSTVGDLAFSLLHGSEPVPLQTILASFVNDLVAARIERTVILDDLHLVENEETLAGLLFLIERLPESVRLILGTRSEPAIPLARMRSSGKLRDLGVGDLEFDKAEAESYLEEFLRFQQGARGARREVTLNPDVVNVLSRQTEGWIAGLQMAALSVQTGEGNSGTIDGFSGSTREVYDFLLEEVLEQQSPETREFLLATSILPFLSGPLCDSVTGGSGSADLLESLHRANLFVVPLDDVAHRYRYHHLFSEVLQARLQRQLPGLQPAFHRRAASWFSDQGDLARAIPHALESGDVQLSADLVELFWRETDRRFQPRIWLDKARQLPGFVFEDRPVLNLGMGWALLDTSEIDDGERYLDQARSLLDHPSPKVSDQETFESLEAFLSAAYAFVGQARGDWEATKRHAERALELLPDHESAYRGIPLVILGLARLRTGQLEQAFPYFSDAADQFQRAGDTLFHHASLYMRGEIRLMQGYLAEARVHLESACSVIEAGSSGPSYRLTQTQLALVQAVLEEGDAEGARARLIPIMEREVKAPDLKRRLLVLEAGILEMEGHPAKSLEVLVRADQYPPSPRTPEPVSVSLLRARLLAKRGDYRQAAALVADHGADNEPEKPADWTLHGAMRLLMHLDLESGIGLNERDAISTRCAQEADDAEKDGRLIDVVEWLLLATAVLSKSSRTEAEQHARRAIRLATKHHMVRCCATTIHDSDVFREVLAEADDEFSRRVLYFLGASVQETDASGPDALSERETEILGLIVDGLKNQEIADRLFISVATVKRHIANVYGKMGVRNRTAAIKEARMKGWLR